MMEFPIGLVLFALVSAVPLALVLAEARLGAPLRYAARLQELARRVGGRAVRRSSFVGGHVSWVRAGYPFYAYETELSQHRWTVLVVGWKGMSLPPFQLRAADGILPFYSPGHRLPVHTGDARDDGRYQLRYPEGSRKAPGLSPAVLERYLALAALYRPQSPLLMSHRSQCRVYLPGVLRRRGGGTRLDAGCRLLDALLREHVLPPPTEQMRIVDVLMCETGAEAACRVCGDPIGRDAVQCAKCLTAHHRECWEYASICSTYGCGGKELRPAEDPSVPRRGRRP